MGCHTRYHVNTTHLRHLEIETFKTYLLATTQFVAFRFVRSDKMKCEREGRKCRAPTEKEEVVLGDPMVYYHGRVSKAEAERLLLSAGDFLVRKDGHGQLVVSMRTGDGDGVAEAKYSHLQMKRRPNNPAHIGRLIDHMRRFGRPLRNCRPQETLLRRPVLRSEAALENQRDVRSICT